AGSDDKTPSRAAAYCGFWTRVTRRDPILSAGPGHRRSQPFLYSKVSFARNARPAIRDLARPCRLPREANPDTEYSLRQASPHTATAEIEAAFDLGPRAFRFVSSLYLRLRDSFQPAI